MKYRWVKDTSIWWDSISFDNLLEMLEKTAIYGRSRLVWNFKIQNLEGLPPVFCFFLYLDGCNGHQKFLIKLDWLKPLVKRFALHVVKK